MTARHQVALFYFMQFTKKNLTLFFLVTILLAITSCSNGTPKKKNQTVQKQKNEEILIVGLLPTMDCMPFCLAQEKNIYAQLGLNVKFIFFNSQMDMDKDLAEGKINVGTSDIFRTILQQNEKKPIKFLICSQREWQLIANKKLRITKVSQMGDRMVGMARNSIPDFYCDFIARNLKKNSGMLLRPQINNIILRLQMLNDNQIDAAVLPQPQALQAINKGNIFIAKCNEQCDHLAGFAVNTKINKKQKKQVELLLKGYNIAIDSIKAHPINKLSKNMTIFFRIDSISTKIQKSTSFSPLFDASPAKISLAIQWMKKRNLLKKYYTTKELIYK